LREGKRERESVRQAEKEAEAECFAVGDRAASWHICVTTGLGGKV